MKRFWFCFSGFFLLLIISSQLSALRIVFAANEFETKYKIEYRINNKGIANVNQNISLTNKFSQVYASKYSLTLPSIEIRNIKASDKIGPCQTEIIQGKETTTIVINFNEQVVGLGKTLEFNLNYESLDMARKNGEVWEINIPKIANIKEIDSYEVTLAVSNFLGKPAFSRPEPVEQFSEGDFNFYRFVKTQLIESGINMAFGPFQVFDFTFFYHLLNPNFTVGETEIALPPDTAFQQLSYQKIEPQPLNIRIDEDGNWLAKYRLKPKEKLKITATGQVKIFAQPQENFPKPTQENLQKNLLPAKYWEVDNNEIIKIAQELKTPKKIYDFVIKTLNYDYQRIEEKPERMGALKALANPDKAICMEFTDLFVALSRAAGIPARAIDGFAYTTDSRLRPLGLMADILHAWPEYYDEKKQVWVPVDPTWGKTTGGVDYFNKTDLNHFTFAIHGVDSELPYPVGSYKQEDTIGKNVQVGFGQYSKNYQPDIKVQVDLPKEVFWNQPQKGKIILANKGQNAFYGLEIKVESLKPTLFSSITKEIALLPPFASVEIPLSIELEKIFSTSRFSLINVSVGEKSYTEKIKIGSFLEQIIAPAGFLVTLLTLFILLKKKF